MTETIALSAAGILFLAGLAGTILPLLPGPVLIWAGMLVYGLIAGFENLSFGFLAIQALLVLCLFGLDYLFSALGTRYFGGSRAALAGASVGLLAGIFFFPVGLLIGPFLGAALAELIIRRKTAQAIRSGFGASIGFWVALPAKLGIEAIMIFWFLLRVWHTP
jgi:uncharacterized protein